MTRYSCVRLCLATVFFFSGVFLFVCLSVTPAFAQAPPSNPLILQIDVPASGAALPTLSLVAGWTLDTSAPAGRG